MAQIMVSGLIQTVNKTENCINGESGEYETFKIGEDQIIGLVKKHFDFRPKAIIEKLDLKRPIYKKTAAYGHFGRQDKDFTWEQTDMAEILKKEAGL